MGGDDTTYRFQHKAVPVVWGRPSRLPEGPYSSYKVSSDTQVHSLIALISRLSYVVACDSNDMTDQDVKW